MHAGRHCFGYGSLVNRRTHDFQNSQTSSLIGWRRTWSHRVDTKTRSASSLTIEEAPGVTINGLTSLVAPSQIADLDARERGYALIELNTSTADGALAAQPLFTYVSQDLTPGGVTYPILQSYLDTVLLGFFTEFGEPGIHHFLSTTVGWETPILLDRQQPKYPRYTKISNEFADFIDTELAKIRARWISQTP